MVISFWIDYDINLTIILFNLPFGSYSNGISKLFCHLSMFSLSGIFHPPFCCLSFAFPFCPIITYSNQQQPLLSLSIAFLFSPAIHHKSFCQPLSYLPFFSATLSQMLLAFSYRPSLKSKSLNYTVQHFIETTQPIFSLDSSVSCSTQIFTFC